jgi:DNA replication protein DnaC/primosomal protein DnaI
VPKRYLEVEPDYSHIDDLENGLGTYLYGTRGVGKTYSACAMLKAYVARHTNDSGWCSARFVSANAWLDSIQETFGRWNSSAEEAFQRAAGTGLLVIDDFGKLNSKANDWALSRLFRLVDERYSDMRPTIFTSKYSLSQLAERFSAVDPETSGDLISRIRETCRGVPMTGADRRLAS